MEIRPAVPEDAIQLAPRLRRADLQEIQASCGLPPEVSLQDSLKESIECFTAIDTHPVAMFGVGAEGMVWMMGSDEIATFKAVLFRETGPYLDRFHKRFPLLWNYVDARNDVHIRWLRRFDFSLICLHPHMGVERRPFYEFVRIDPNV